MGMSSPAPSGQGGLKFRYKKPPVAEINVTPFVDVILVLLIVFMVTAPMMTQGVQVALPQTDNAAIEAPSEPLEISIKANGDVFVGVQKLGRENLNARFEAIAEARQNQSQQQAVLLRADQGVAYGTVMQVMSALQSAGLVDVGLITEPVQ